jgi:hypothetical protein
MDDRSGVSYAKNRRAVVERMVVYGGGGYVYVHGPVRTDGKQNTTKVRGGLALQDTLRDLVYDLLTAVSDDVQDRFHMERGDGLRGGLAFKGSNALLADDVIGPYLANAIRVSSEATPPPHSGKPE